MQIKPSRLGVSLNWDYKCFNHIDKVDKNYKFYLYNEYIRSYF